MSFSKDSFIPFINIYSTHISITINGCLISFIEQFLKIAAPLSTVSTIEKVEQLIGDVSIRMGNLDDHLENFGMIMSSLESNLVPNVRSLTSEVASLRRRIAEMRSGDDCARLPAQLRRDDSSIFTEMFPTEPDMDKQDRFAFVKTWWFNAALAASFLSVVILMAVVFFLLCMKRRAAKAVRNISEQIEMHA